jgi:hypothetical protein
MNSLNIFIFLINNLIICLFIFYFYTKDKLKDLSKDTLKVMKKTQINWQLLNHQFRSF